MRNWKIIRMVRSGVEKEGRRRRQNRRREVGKEIIREGGTVRQGRIGERRGGQEGWVSDRREGRKGGMSDCVGEGERSISYIRIVGKGMNRIRDKIGERSRG